MISPDTLKRLAKGVDDERTNLKCIHIKDNFAEVTDGKILVRETLPEAQKEAYLEPDTFQPVTVEYPDTENYVSTNKAKPTLYKIGLAPDVLKKFLSMIPKQVEQINLEIKGANSPIYFSCNKLEGLIMPMAVEEISKPSVEVKNDSVETRIERSIAKVTVLYSDGKEETLNTTTEEVQKEEPAKQPAPVEAAKEPAKVPEKPAEKKSSPLPLKTAQKKEAPMVLEANLL